VDFFVVTIIDIHQLNLGPFGGLNFLLKIHSKYVFFSFVSEIKEKYCMYLFFKPIPNEKERDFKLGIALFFQFSFF
jgi:hypothetical protein